MRRTLFLAFAALLAAQAREPLAQRIAHTDPSKYQSVQAVHQGVGQLDFMALLDAHSLDTNLYFVHRGVLQPKSSMGHHFHNNCEEMLVILEGEAQVTVDGRTSQLKGPVAIPSKLGHSHGIFNHTGKPIQIMNINVSVLKGENDAYNLDDPRVGVPLDPVPTFMTMPFDRALLRPVNNMSGGKGTVQYRRGIGPSVFTGPWAYVDHLLLPPGTMVGQATHRGVAEVYYVMQGSGSVTVLSAGSPAETADIRAGDAVPIQLNETHSFQNAGTEPLELLVIGVSRERNKEIADSRLPLNRH